MVAELARSVSRPDLGVRLARNARKSSDSWLWTAGYPRLPLSPLMERHRSEEHTSELQSLMRISYAVFCLKKKKIQTQTVKVRTHNTLRRQTRQIPSHKYNLN